MPSKPRTPCPVPGCPELTSGGRCVEHKSQADKRRGTTRERGYALTKWQRVRKAYIYKHPWCVLCAKAATVADHYPLSRRELEAKGDPNPDSPKHLRPLCTSCHNKETAKHQPGGWAHERGARSVTLNAYGRFASDPDPSR